MLSKLIAHIPRLSKLIGVLAYDSDQKLFQLDGKRLGFAFLCAPLAGSNGDEGDRLRAGLALEWPEGSTIQFSLICTENINRVKTGYLKLRQVAREAGRFTVDQATQDLLATAMKARAEYFAERTLRPVDSVSGVKIRDQKLIIAISLPIKESLPSDSEAVMARELADALGAALESCGLAPVPLTNHAYKEVLSSVLNQGPDASWRLDPDIKADLDKPINEQLLDYNRSLDVRRDHIQLGDDCFAKTLSVKRYPDIMWQGDATQYLADILSQRGGVRGNCVITLTLFFPAQLETKDKLIKRRQWAINQCSGPMVKFVPMLLKRKEAYDALFEDLDRGVHNIQANMAVVVFGKSREELTRATSSAKTHFAAQGFTLMEDKFCLLPVFIGALPLCADTDAIRDLFRFRTMSLAQALPILPIYGDWKGTGTPVAPFISRNGQPVTFDLYDSQDLPQSLRAGGGLQRGGGRAGRSADGHGGADRPARRLPDLRPEADSDQLLGAEGAGADRGRYRHCAAGG